MGKHPDARPPESSLVDALVRRGFSLREERGMTVRFDYPSDAARDTYRRLTYCGQKVGISLYFIDHWLEFVRPKHVSLLARLWGTARRGRNPRRTMTALADSIRLGEDALYEFLRWWRHPQPEDLEWLIVRAYIRDIQPAGPGGRGSRPYLFSILLDDPLAEEDLDQLDVLTAAVVRQRSGQRRLPLRDPTGKALGAAQTLADEETRHERVGKSGSSPLGAERVGKRVGKSGDSLPQEQEESENPALSGPPIPPHEPEPCHGGMAQYTAAEFEESGRSGESGDSSGEPSRAAAILAARGFPEADAERLIDHHPEAPHWIVQWHEWMRVKSPKEPLAFFASRVRAACAGDAEARSEPWKYGQLKALEEREAERQRKQRIQATPAQPRKRTSDETVVSERAAPVWAAAREAVGPMAAGFYLDPASSVDLHEGVLIVSIRSSQSRALQEHLVLPPEIQLSIVSPTKGATP